MNQDESKWDKILGKDDLEIAEKLLQEKIQKSMLKMKKQKNLRELLHRLRIHKFRQVRSAKDPRIDRLVYAYKCRYCHTWKIGNFYSMKQTMAILIFLSFGTGCLLLPIVVAIPIPIPLILLGSVAGYYMGLKLTLETDVSEK